MSRLRRIGLAIKCEDYSRRMTPVQDVLAGGVKILDGEPRPTATAFGTFEDGGQARETDLEKDVAR